MGEYAKYNGQDIKIGTCENMYYLRWDQRHKVQALSGSVNPVTDVGLFFRVPLKEEDNIEPGNFEPFVGMRMYRKVETPGTQPDSYEDFEPNDLEPGHLQMSHNCGYLMSVPCYHGAKLPEGVAWNGKSWFLELRFIKRTETGFKPVVGCRHCGRMWSYDLEDVQDWLVPYMVERIRQMGDEELEKNAGYAHSDEGLLPPQ